LGRFRFEDESDEVETGELAASSSIGGLPDLRSLASSQIVLRLALSFFLAFDRFILPTGVITWVESELGELFLSCLGETSYMVFRRELALPPSDFFWPRAGVEVLGTGEST